MKTTNFNWGDNIIDSRDIISRYEELNDEYESLVGAVEAAEEDLNAFIKEHGVDDYEEHVQNSFETLDAELEDAKDLVGDFINSDDMGELEMLKEIVSQGEDAPDWSYGEALIHEDYFTDYIKELVNDCYEIPKEINEGNWPFNHVEMDWEGAAEEAKSDYNTIEVDGETYLIRA